MLMLYLRIKKIIGMYEKQEKCKNNCNGRLGFSSTFYTAFFISCILKFLIQKLFFIVRFLKKKGLKKKLNKIVI